MLIKGSLDATLSQGQARGSSYYMTCHTGWVGGSARPLWQGSALQIMSKSIAKKHCQRNSRGIGLELCTCFIPWCSTCQEIQWARIEGQLHSCSKSLCHSASLGAGWGRAQGRGLKTWEPPTPACVSLLLTWQFSDKTCVQGQEKYQSWTQTGLYANLQKKKKKNTTDVAESKTFKSESFLEEGKVFQIMSKMSLNSTHRRMKRNTQFMWRGGCWLQTFKAVRALLWQVTP